MNLTATNNTLSQFRYYFHCSGKEREATDCMLSESDYSLCDNNMVVTLHCDTGDVELVTLIYHLPVNSLQGSLIITGSVSSPVQLTLRAVSSDSVEANWTQPALVSSQYRVGNHSISCTSCHGVYTTTHVSASVEESTHIHMIVSGLTSNTSYTCCVSAHSELGTSEQVCDTVVTTSM